MITKVDGIEFSTGKQTNFYIFIVLHETTTMTESFAVSPTEIRGLIFYD